jgi:hypothetical protein
MPRARPHVLAPLARLLVASMLVAGVGLGSLAIGETDEQGRAPSPGTARDSFARIEDWAVLIGREPGSSFTEVLPRRLLANGRLAPHVSAGSPRSRPFAFLSHPDQPRPAAPAPALSVGPRGPPSDLLF